ncbi:hypothetical protein QQF64_026375 [Cirrhinus molitorella]|uniref:Uncharacterized protein n=1 Tax=Cirrhinus molitorella TaxID=172907 RepID=A0ABR3NA03_9TELE
MLMNPKKKKNLLTFGCYAVRAGAEGGRVRPHPKGAGRRWVCLSADARRSRSRSLPFPRARALHLRRGRQRQRIARLHTFAYAATAEHQPAASERTDGRTRGETVSMCASDGDAARWSDTRGMLLLLWRDADAVMHHFA